MLEVKDGKKILEEAGEKGHITFEGNPKRLKADFSTETMKAMR